MSDDPEDLFSRAKRIAEAKAAKSEGMERSEGGALPEWSVLMYELVIKAARAMPIFNSDDVFDLYDDYRGAPTTHDKRAFGLVMMRAARAGVCRNTGRVVPSRRQSLHASPRAMWESLIYGK